ncbi:MAG: hypothetical protein V3T72_03245 [Thermoanaerobaculia bacterium]
MNPSTVESRPPSSVAVSGRPSAPPPHAPELGRASRLLGRFHVTGVFWFRLHRVGISILPEWGVWLFTVLFTTFFFVALRRIRKAISANLDAALGSCGWWRRQERIYRTMWNFAWCLSERYERLSTERRVTPIPALGEEHWQRALADPEGLILITAHVGHWEVGSMMVPERHVNVVREEEMDPRAQKFVLELFEQQAASSFTMHFARDDPALGLQLLKALRRGEYVAVQGDRPRTSGRTCNVELFGRRLALPAGPAALARAANVALMPVFVFRRGRHRSQVVFRPPVRVEHKGEAGIAEAMGRIAAEIEWAILHQPHQWFCFRQLWGERR